MIKHPEHSPQNFWYHTSVEAQRSDDSKFLKQKYISTMLHYSEVDHETSHLVDIVAVKAALDISESATDNTSIVDECASIFSDDYFSASDDESYWSSDDESSTCSGSIYITLDRTGNCEDVSVVSSICSSGSDFSEGDEDEWTIDSEGTSLDDEDFDGIYDEEHKFASEYGDKTDEVVMRYMQLNRTFVAMMSSTSNADNTVAAPCRVQSEIVFEMNEKLFTHVTRRRSHGMISILEKIAATNLQLLKKENESSRLPRVSSAASI